MTLSIIMREPAPSAQVFFFAIRAGSQVAPLLSSVVESGGPLPDDQKHVARALLQYAVAITSRCDISTRLDAPREYLQVRTPLTLFSSHRPRLRLTLVLLLK